MKHQRADKCMHEQWKKRKMNTHWGILSFTDFSCLEIAAVAVSWFERCSSQAMGAGWNVTACLCAFLSNFADKFNIGLWKVWIVLNCVKLKIMGAFEHQQLKLKLHPLRPIQRVPNRPTAALLSTALTARPQLPVQGWKLRRDNRTKLKTAKLYIHDPTSWIRSDILSLITLKDEHVDLLTVKTLQEMLTGTEKKREKNSKTLLVGECKCRCSSACMRACVWDSREAGWQWEEVFPVHCSV